MDRETNPCNGFKMTTVQGEGCGGSCAGFCTGTYKDASYIKRDHLVACTSPDCGECDGSVMSAWEYWTWEQPKKCRIAAILDIIIKFQWFVRYFNLYLWCSLHWLFCLFNLADANVECDAGEKGAGGVCNCNEAAGWDEGKWETPVCHKGNCYAGQSYEECGGKDNGHPIGDGTFCWDQKRYTQCSTSGENNLPLYIPWFLSQFSIMIHSFLI